MELIALLGLLILLGLSIFQILLIAGRPLGNFAWGGQHKVLPKKLRAASISSIVLYVVFALFLAEKANFIDTILSEQLVDTGMWVYTIYFIIGIPLNLISRSKKERLVMTPVVLLLATIFLIVTLI